MPQAKATINMRKIINLFDVKQIERIGRMNLATKSMISLLLCLCVTSALFVGCSSKEKTTATDQQLQNYSELTETESFPVKLKLDKEYIIQSKPRRLAVLSADLVQALEDIGAANLISSVSNDAPATASTSGAKQCGSVLDPNLEQIIANKTDWVLVSSQMRRSQIEQLKQEGIGVITFSRPADINEIKLRYRQLFSLCYGLEGATKSEEFLNAYQSKLDEIIQPAADYAKLGQRKSVIYLAKPDYTLATGETFEGKLMYQMGMHNIGELGSRWNYPELERKALTPEVIFYDKLLPIEAITESEIYKDSPAVQSEQLIPIDFSAVRLQGMPMLEELSKMATAVYPQAYGL